MSSEIEEEWTSTFYLGVLCDLINFVTGCDEIKICNTLLWHYNKRLDEDKTIDIIKIFKRSLERCGARVVGARGASNFLELEFCTKVEEEEEEEE